MLGRAVQGRAVICAAPGLLRPRVQVVPWGVAVSFAVPSPYHPVIGSFVLMVVFVYYSSTP